MSGMRVLLLSLVVSCLHQRGVSSHIMGADITYRCLNAQAALYEVTLTMYRDCDEGQIGFDPAVLVFLFAGSDGERLGFYPLRPAFEVPDTISLPSQGCSVQPINICAEVGQYVDTLPLPPREGGYDIGWARCCRNAAAMNVAQDEGISVMTHIPSMIENSSPLFQALPPLFFCAQEEFTLEFEASDADGDSLAYHLVTPYTGQNHRGWGAHLNFPTVIPENPMGPPPYLPLDFLPGYDAYHPFASQSLTFDELTGLMQIGPSQPGLYVYAVEVSEYRNGRLLSKNRRDFQIEVVPCRPQGTKPTIVHDLSGNDFSNDTIYIQAGDSLTYSLTIEDEASTDVVALFPASAVFGIGGSLPPPHASLQVSGTNPAQGIVSWKTPCMLNAKSVPLIVGGKDLADCEGTNQVFDTIWVAITPTQRVQAGSDTTICRRGGIAQLSALYAKNYDWNPADGLSDHTVSHPLASPDSSQFYIVTGEDPLGCTSKDTVLVELTQEVEGIISGPDSLCLGEPMNLTGEGVGDWIWSSGDTSATLMRELDRSTMYWAIPLDSLGCRGDTMFHAVFVVYPLVQAAFDALPAEGYPPLQVYAQNQSQAAHHYTWYVEGERHSERINTEFTFTEPGQYKITLVAQGVLGCFQSVYSQEIDLWGSRLYIPNIFTPNNDGLNDYLKIAGGGIESMEFAVFDRWGRELYRTTNHDFQWGGLDANGNPVPEGNYAFLLKAETAGQGLLTRRGTITIVR